ncbi:transposase [Nocardia sp. SYP-A9097]|uniref:integrase core domain-containing protein n=1 Tax=Nocardia sp. SYP-A9097 TaxID=2663237 RepID=UPI00129A5B80|nr:integrase core domain-containing protein [Nocardia sp. SYP-A9097]MRH93492.1 transposase [Nocardia sp. SYP-A9097]
MGRTFPPGVGAPGRSNPLILRSSGKTSLVQKCQAAVAEELGVRRSAGRTGTCFDNAWAESFNGTLKNERVNRTEYPTREHARRNIISYIELRYNQIRLHSGIYYHTPNELESAWFERNQAA